jgi:hypothetical protein
MLFAHSADDNRIEEGKERRKEEKISGRKEAGQEI